MQYVLDIPIDKITVITSMCFHMGIPIERVPIDERAWLMGVTLTRITEMVADVFGVTVEEMVSRSQKQELVLARNVCFVIAYEHLGMNLKAIGMAFSGRDHSTVIHGKVQIMNHARQEPYFREQAKSVEQRLFPEAESVF